MFLGQFPKFYNNRYWANSGFVLKIWFTVIKVNWFIKKNTLETFLDQFPKFAIYRFWANWVSVFKTLFTVMKISCFMKKKTWEYFWVDSQNLLFTYFEETELHTTADPVLAFRSCNFTVLYCLLLVWSRACN